MQRSARDTLPWLLAQVFWVELTALLVAGRIMRFSPGQSPYCFPLGLFYGVISPKPMKKIKDCTHESWLLFSAVIADQAGCLRLRESLCPSLWMTGLHEIFTLYFRQQECLSTLDGTSIAYNESSMSIHGTNRMSLSHSLNISSVLWQCNWLKNKIKFMGPFHTFLVEGECN